MKLLLASVLAVATGTVAGSALADPAPDPWTQVDGAWAIPQPTPLAASTPAPTAEPEMPTLEPVVTTPVPTVEPTPEPTVAPVYVAPEPVKTLTPKTLAPVLGAIPPFQSTNAVVVAGTNAAAEFGISSVWLLRVAYCESGYSMAARGRAGEIGAWQFMPATFTANAARIGYAPASIYDATAQARTAAYMFSIGQAGQWTCK